eukprot:1848321-Amphidinium_carterae.1
MPADEEEEAGQDHHVHTWDEDDEPVEDEAEEPVFEFEALVEVVEAERPKQVSRWLALRLVYGNPTQAELNSVL